MAGSKNMAFLKQLAMSRIADEGGISDHVAPENAEVQPPVGIPMIVDPLSTVRRQDLEVGDRELRAQGEKRAQREGSSQNAPTSVQASAKRSRHENPHEGRAQKKSKSSKSKHRSDAVVVDSNFLKDNAEEYRSDPVGAAAKLLAHLAEVRKVELTEHLRRVNVDLDIERAARYRATKQLEERQVLLDKLTESCRTAEGDRDKYRGRAEAAEKRVKELETQITQLEGEEKAAKEKIADLEQQISQLETSLKKLEDESVRPCEDLEKEVADLKLKLKESKEQGSRAASLALEMAGEGFQNALRQVSLINPSVCVDSSALNVDHEVEGDQIVKVDASTGKKTVVYPSVS